MDRDGKLIPKQEDQLWLDSTQYPMDRISEDVGNKLRLSLLNFSKISFTSSICFLVLERTRPVPIGNLPIGPPPPVPLSNASSVNPVPQSAIAPPPPPMYSQTHTQMQYNTRTVVNEVNEVKTAPQTESVMNQQQPQETHPAPSSENIKETMNAIDATDEMLRKEGNKVLEYVCRKSE
ncbi:hypothetical protein WR25_25148 [Diploscapter pachys]|uniref:Uncharacterized protein n=1 Tax=Diploscapter pachys TaxID=2018661 RepID=A0A2A2LVV8_9BILA|nr:hypothetical protein WR25_25148 [Diploscapter pachys]